MSEAVIRVDGVGKRYRIGTRERYRTLRDVLAGTLSMPLRRLRPAGGRVDPSGGADATVWALKDVSFEVARGEVVGIIGRNGAGKSTLLKILSRITEPTEGRARIRGRVGALLEVGTGFHPELTGRENIYLSGAILGMKRAEIDRRFDEIVAFSEIERFIDTPVKHYSSGMYPRLAFSVAAHLEPEILLVDEVLAVGDIAFQQKCLGKMGSVAMEGRTILFVSHNMAVIKKLCGRAILLQNGCVATDDRAEAAVGRYLDAGVADRREVVWNPDVAPRTDEWSLRAVRVLDRQGRIAGSLTTADPITVEVEYDVAVPVRGLRVHIRLCTPDGVDVFTSSDLPAWPGSDARPAGRYVSRCVLPGALLNVGTYLVRVGAAIPKYKELLADSEYVSFVVSDLVDNPMGLTSRGPRGVINPKLDWIVDRIG